MEPFEGLNWAVIKQIQVIPYEFVSFPLYQNQIDFDEILVENGKNFEEIPFIFESALFRENEELTNSGIKWLKEVILMVPKLRSEVSEFFKNYENRKLILLITDMNNENHLAFPMRMTRQRNIPGRTTGLNATEITFKGEWTDESPSVVNMS